RPDDAITRLGDVARGHAPGDVDLDWANCGRAAGAASVGRSRVAARRSASRRAIREWAEVPGGVQCPVLVAVARARREAGVLVCRCRPRRSKQRVVRARGTLTAQDLIAGDADVVRRRTPCEVDFTRVD